MKNGSDCTISEELKKETFCDTIYTYKQYTSYECDNTTLVDNGKI